MKQEILLVDDDRLLLKTLSEVLTEAGYSVRTVSNPEKVAALVRAQRPDLVLLDVMMPKKSGLDLCRELRDCDAALPIVFLTGLDSSEDELKGLAAGGDFYIAKTTPDVVLLARLAAILRPRGEPDESLSDFEFGSWRIHGGMLQAESRSGQWVELSERELYLLRLFAKNPRTVFSRDELITRLWTSERMSEDAGLTVLIYTLRKKLGKTGQLIEVVRGLGYTYRP